MDKKRLELLLQRVPPHPSPDPALEQYGTSADVAADLLISAALHGDITGRRVIDLGCGTGILAIGAALLGASKVTGIDIDGNAIDVARAAAEGLGVEVELLRADVSDVGGDFDTAVMNPPFGAQRREADRPFLERAIALAGVVYSIHNAPTARFVRTFAEACGAVVTHEWPHHIVIPHMFDFHGSRRRRVPVVILRIEKA